VSQKALTTKPEIEIKVRPIITFLRTALGNLETAVLVWLEVFAALRLTG
jgi:hypothetical protein